MFEHYSVLNIEAVENVLNDLSGTYVDGTLGAGGHTKTLLENLNKDAKVYAFDQDISAVNYNEQNISDNRLQIIHSNFKHIKEQLNKKNVNIINGVILDLGFSSPQVDNPKRGFSYIQDGPLDMRMDVSQTKTAYDIVNSYSKEQLLYIFNKYGEEKNANFITNKIIEKRKEQEINSTLQLVDIIEQAIPIKFKKQIKGHIAKKVFQALRIEVNDELKILDQTIDDIFEILNNKGRICIITFHSLEDKIVKNKFRKLSSVEPHLTNLPIIPKEYLPKGKLITNKPILPTEEEVKENKRSKSAKLRVLEKNEI